MAPDEPEPAVPGSGRDASTAGQGLETVSLGCLAGGGGAIASLALSYAVILLGVGLAEAGLVLSADLADALGFAGMLVGPVTAGIGVGWIMRTALDAFLSALFPAAIMAYPLLISNALALMSTSGMPWITGWIWLIYCVSFVIAAVVGGALRQHRDARGHRPG